MITRRTAEKPRSLRKDFAFTPVRVKSVPCAMALWTSNHLFRGLNERAKELLGFSEQELRKDPSLWMNRIYPEDRSRVAGTWRKLRAGEKVLVCDYRFFPKNQKKPIWLRDESTSYQGLHGNVEFISSAYTDISDLKADLQSEQKEGGSKVVEIVGGVVHEVQNNLQVINLEFDLVRSGYDSPAAPELFADTVERTSKSVQELREYLFPPKSQFSKENPGIILQDVVRQMEEKLQRQGVRVRLVHPPFLPLVDLDERQFRKMLQRVVEFSRALLPQGGVMEIRSGRRKIRNRQYIELKVVSSSATSLGLEEKDVFRPFLRVNGYQVGLSIELAQQILRRHHGLISFQKQTPKKGQFTILLRALPN